MKRFISILFLLFATASSCNAQFLPFWVPFSDIFNIPTTVQSERYDTEVQPLPRQLIPKLYIKNAQLVDEQGKNIIMRGTNWFGFNNGQTMVDGLWSGGTSAATDFSTVIYQLKLLGFNTIRLPFTFTDLKLDVLDKKITCKVLTLEELYNRARKRQAPTGPLTLSGNVCNVDMPNTGKTIDRFIWAIRRCILHGLYVVIDYHGMGQEQSARDPIKFAKQWNEVWSAIKDSPYYDRELDRRVVIDIFNEPDSMGLKWKEMSAIYKEVMQRTQYSLYMIEGTGQVAWNMNWGDGFVTNRDIIKKTGIDDANVFFSGLEKQYRDKIIISPHIYGPSITRHKAAFKGSAFFERLNASFGKFVGVYPIVIGEFGINFKNSQDIELMKDFSKWLRLKGIKGWLHWNYAENGADTDNIAVNNWQDINWKIINWLRKDFDLGV